MSTLHPTTITKDRASYMEVYTSFLSYGKQGYVYVRPGSSTEYNSQLCKIRCMKGHPYSARFDYFVLKTCFIIVQVSNLCWEIYISSRVPWVIILALWSLHKHIMVTCEFQTYAGKYTFLQGYPESLSSHFTFLIVQWL
jgi:hypothetical protein